MGRHRLALPPRPRPVRSGRVAGWIIVAFLLVLVMVAGVAASEGNSPPRPVVPATVTPPGIPSDFRLPSTSPSAGPAHRLCHVRPGDSLWTVAARCLGNGADWKLLARVNHLSYPWTLTPGEALSSR